MRARSDLRAGRTLLLAALCAAAAPQPDFPDPHSLTLELQRLKSRILQANSPAEMPQLPDSWQVESDGREYSISTEPLRKIISNPKTAASWIDDLSAQLDPPRSALPSRDTARARLNQILSRREFRTRAENRSAWNDILNAISNWIRTRLFRALAGGRTSGTWLFLGWSLLLAGAILVVWLISRFLERRRKRAQQPSETPAESQPAEADWLAIATAAAQSGDFRTAIHAEYWASVTRLRQTGLLPADLTRTPRELLSSVPPAPEYAPFSHLTRDFERFWYAGAPAAHHDFRRASSYAEALGCRAI